jgi:vacuolar-type H+-ATPase subunit F/Vma7
LGLKIAVVGDEYLTAGFALAGASFSHRHLERGETLRRLEEFMRNEEIGLIFITHKIADELEPEFSTLMRDKGTIPVVLKIPGEEGYMPEVDELYQVVKRTVGAEVVVRAEE